jgi:hypothetical protein
MPKWFWYVARDNELFLDVDNVERVIHHLRQRLQGAIEYKRLDVAHVYRQRSQGKNGQHEHIIVTLNNKIPPVERFVWEIILRSDLYRGCNNIMRHLRGIGAPDIFISRSDCFFFRPYDTFCYCTKKHSPEIMEKCPTAEILRGDYRAQGFFGKPSQNPCKFI